MFAAAVTGFSTGLILILVIGAQGAFVLRHGVHGAHIFAVCTTCAISDAVLISAGVLASADWRPSRPI